MPAKSKPSTRHFSSEQKASKTKPKRQEPGSPFHVEWSHRFTPLHDSCYDCIIQIVNPIRKGRFSSRLIVGIDPFDNKIRFMSVAPRLSIFHTRATLEKVIHESRGFQVQYSNSELKQVAATRKLITQIKKLIQHYFP